jgi:DHA3 family multidrug efflux protein-like MFS transporter
MKIFYSLLGTVLVAAATNNYVWFALVFWLYLETQSVVATGLAGGMYFVVSALSSFWFGSLVDNHKKKSVMLGSSIASLIFFSISFLVYSFSPESAFHSLTSPILWTFVFCILCGTLAGNIYGIVVPTLVTVLVPETMRDKANGMVGTIMGLAFSLTSVASGLVLGNFGMSWVLGSAVILTICVFVAILLLDLTEQQIIHTHSQIEVTGIDIRGTIHIISSIKGLFALIFLTTFNNLLGGVFMALMDAYGLTLVSVQTWGLLWGGLSMGFIIGGLYISKYGLGTNPVQSLFKVYIVLWSSTILFAVQPSIVLLAVGVLVWLILSPFIEATEQTIIQKVVPAQRQGRVFGFAHSVEQAASPLTAFLIGPITQAFFIPLMTTGRGAELIGSWFGVGAGRGMAVVFITTGIIGLIITLLAMRLRAYRELAIEYTKN